MYSLQNSGYLLKFVAFSSPTSTLKSFSTRISHNELRQSFLNYFKCKGHDVVGSSSVIPSDNDGTLLFTNAGMNQFKPVILDPNSQKRSVVSVQKCIRAGGKHNDLDDVGSDLHHQTFFEMLGNWSFNNAYSKEEACRWAWEYLTEHLHIDPKRLYVSYFSGSKKLGLAPDTECKDIWKSIGVPDWKILPFEKENFWEMGASGPCGPCTEIHFDRSDLAATRNAAGLVNIDDSVVELWNIVFMSNLRLATGEVQKLHSAHVDTGMGFERLLSVVQRVPSNFDTDVFEPLFGNISEVSKKTYGGKDGVEHKHDEQGRIDVAFRIVADHVRAATVAMCDGAAPANTGPGFVVRKMLRRAFLQSSNVLRMERQTIGELVPIVAQTLGVAYPELNEFAKKNIVQIVDDEEKQFWKVVDKGVKKFQALLDDVHNGSSVFPGKSAFVLHDTHGVSLEITEELARQKGFTVDVDEYDRLREMAKGVSKTSSTFGVDICARDFPTHSDAAKYDYRISAKNTGEYEFPKRTSKVLAIYEGGRRLADGEELKETGFVVLEDCQFYAEEGGQKTDRGDLLDASNEVCFTVEWAKKFDDVSVLFGRLVDGRRLRQGSQIVQSIDVKRRLGLMRAHTATHLLNWALRRAGLGAGQRGSSLDEDSLRFDYAVVDDDAEKQLEKVLLDSVEAMIRKKIDSCEPTFVENLPLDEARKLKQLQSEFRERKRYPETVRICGIGYQLAASNEVVECCSGTHVLNTGSIGDFVVMSDKKTAKSVRRIVAFTGAKARRCADYGKFVVEELQSSKQRADVAKKIDWENVPLLQQKTISALLNPQKRHKEKLKKGAKSY